MTVKDKDLHRGRLLEVRVHPEDVGKVIGRQGRTAQALRTVIGALASKGEASASTSSTWIVPRRR